MTEQQGERIIRILVAILFCVSVITGRVVFG
jgi:hypothetical protein